MATTPQTQRFLLLPPRGLQISAAPAGVHLAGLMRGMQPQAAMPAALRGSGMRVLDSVHEDGIKLVELSANGLLQLRRSAPGLRVVPEVFFGTARVPQAALAAKVKPQAGGAAALSTTLAFTVAGSPVAGAHVVAFTDFANGIGAQGDTRADGSVRLQLGGATRIQRLYVYPRQGAWPLVKRNLALPRATPVALRPIDLAAANVLGHFTALAPAGDGAGVTVGIIDTGVGPHPGVPVSGGENTVLGENPADFADNGDQHGTHVAGIVGARGSAPGGLRGLAPACTLRAYRVFGRNSDGASNFAIAKAIDRAVADGCDLINMSLGGEPGGPADPATSAAIADARVAGVAVIVAAGNDGAAAVSQPGADSRAVAVGAFGRKGLFPADSASAESVGRLASKDKLNFMASFSNHGPAIDLAGPGVAVVSTVPGGGFAVMDGTSMACPAVTGAAARLLSRATAVRQMPRDQARSDAILQLAFKAAKALGFGAEFEGQGWPQS